MSVGGLTDVMEGVARPGHFDGVATVVTKLFTQTAATDAFFGEKDYQQLLVVRRMAADLDLPVTVHGCPTIRDIDGLALSSRNLLISDRARTTAPRLHEEMEAVAEGLRDGRRSRGCARRRWRGWSARGSPASITLICGRRMISLRSICPTGPRGSLPPRGWPGCGSSTISRSLDHGRDATSRPLSRQR